MYDGTLRFDTRIDQKGWDKGVNSLKSSANGLKSAFGSIIKGIGITALIVKTVQLGKESIQLASDLQEVQNVVDVSFGGMAEKCETFAKSAIQNFGMSELAAKKYSSSFMAMAKGIGSGEEEGAGMALQATARLGDISSFYNKSFEESYTLMSSVWTAETESLKKIGVVMTEQNLEAFRLAQGITTAYKNMTQEEKAALRLKFVLDQTKLAEGDFVRTQDSWANQTRMLTENFNQLKIVLGTGLIQVLAPVVKGLNVLLIKLTLIAQKFAELTGGLLGKQSLAKGAGAAASSVGDLSDAEGELADNTNAAAKAQQKALASFDTLNKLDSSDTSTSKSFSSAGASIPITPNIQTDDSQIESNVKTAVDKIKSLLEPLKAISFDPLKKSLSGLKDAFAPLSKTIGDGLYWIYMNILVPLATWTIEDLLPAFINLLAGAFDFLSVVLSVANPLLDWLWKNFLEPIAKWAGGVIVDVLNAVADALKKISDWINNNQSLVQGMTVTVLAFFAAWKATELMAFIQMSGGVVACLNSITAATLGATLAKIKDKAETIALTAMYAKDFIVSVANSTVQLVKNTAAWIASTAAKVAHTAAQVAMTVATAAWNVVCAAATAVTTAFGAAVAFLTSPIGLVILAIGAVIAIGILLYKNWDTIKEKASIFGEKIKEVFGAIAEFVKGKINIVIGAMNGMIKGIVSGVNVAIKALNTLKFTVPDWIPGIGGNKFGFNLTPLEAPKIPYLATGAVIPPNAQFAAILGDQKHGTNLEAPESLIRKIVREESGSKGNDVFNITIGDEEVFSFVVRKNNQIVNQTGRSPLLV